MKKREYDAHRLSRKKAFDILYEFFKWLTSRLIFLMDTTTVDLSYSKINRSKIVADAWRKKGTQKNQPIGSTLQYNTILNKGFLYSLD